MLKSSIRGWFSYFSSLVDPAGVHGEQIAESHQAKVQSSDWTSLATSKPWLSVFQHFSVTLLEHWTTSTICIITGSSRCWSLSCPIPFQQPIWKTQPAANRVDRAPAPGQLSTPPPVEVAINKTQSGSLFQELRTDPRNDRVSMEYGGRQFVHLRPCELLSRRGGRRQMESVRLQSEAVCVLYPRHYHHHQHQQG